MLLTKTIKIKIINSVRKHYIDLGYNIIDNKTEVEVRVEDLTIGSGVKVECKCDICGDINIIQYSKYLKNIKNGGYYSCHGKCSREKFKQTCLVKFGVNNPSELDDIKKAIKQTCLERYGVDNYTKTKEYKIKTKKTKLEKYNDENYNNINKNKQTCLERYGVDHPSKIDDYVEKCNKTCITKYNTKHYSQTEEYKKRYKETCLNKYNVESSNSSELIKNIKKINCLKKYGVNNILQLDKIKNTIKNTNLEKYGVEYPLQNIDIFNRNKMSGFKMKKYKTLTYQGTYELDFLEKYYSIINISKSLSIKYIFENKNRVYHPDFYIKSKKLIVEIKSEYYYNLHLDKNLAKQKACIEQGYNFIFIINKNYDNFNKLFLETFI